MSPVERIGRHLSLEKNLGLIRICQPRPHYYRDLRHLMRQVLTVLALKGQAEHASARSVLHLESVVHKVSADGIRDPKAYQLEVSLNLSPVAH